MKKILIIRFSSIGDIVLTSPVIRAVKKQLNGEVHFFTKKSYAALLKANPYIDKLWSMDNDLQQNISQLKKEQFDFVIDLHNNLRTFLVKRQLNKPSRPFYKANIEKWLMVNFKIDKLPEKHIVDRYLEAAAPLGVENDGLGLDYFIPTEDEIDQKDLPERFRNGYVGVVLGAKYATKKLPLHKLIDICDDIKAPVILLGGPEDAETAVDIIKALEKPIYNACGKYNLNQSASLVRQAKVILTHDTGLMHIAAAFNKPVVSVWGNTIPEFGMFPYKTENKIFEIKDLPCRPCSKIGYQKCPKKHFLCMEAQDEAEIAETVNYIYKKQ